MVLRDRMKYMILEEILGKIEGRKVFVLDDFTTRMVANISSMKEIAILCDVASVQSITAMPHGEKGAFKAVYFMRATESNMRKYINDFTLKPAPYKEGHIFLTNTCPDAIFTMLRRAGKKVKGKLKTLTEVYCEYICYSDHCFSLDEKDHFMVHYSPSNVNIRAYESVRIASKLVSLCIQLAHFPSQIRYYHKGTSAANLEIATHVKRALSHFRLENDDFEWESTTCTLVVIDRSFDTISPAIHDLTAEALARDLLAIDVESNTPKERRSSSYTPNRFVYTVQTNSSKVGNEERIAYLDDGNVLWNKIRFMNIKDAVDFMRYEIEQIQKQEQLDAGRVQDLSLTKLTELMKKYPEQRKNKQQIGALSYVLHQTLNNFAREQIECEQILATQVGKRYKDRNWKIVSDLLKKDQNEELNNSLTVHEKIRILYLYARSKAATGGITIKELTERFQESDVPLNYMSIVCNLTFLKVPVLVQDAQWENYEDQVRDWTLWHTCERKNGEAIRPDRMPEFIDWCPNIYHIVKTMIESPDDLHKEYPVLEIRNKPYISKGEKPKRKFSKISKPSVDSISDYEKFSPSSFIVFIAGGMTYGEIKLSTMLTEYFKERAKTPRNINVIFGSTQILNPDDFIEKLLVLNPDDPQFKDEDDNFVTLDVDFD